MSKHNTFQVEGLEFFKLAFAKEALKMGIPVSEGLKHYTETCNLGDTLSSSNPIAEYPLGILEVGKSNICLGFICHKNGLVNPLTSTLYRLPSQWDAAITHMKEYFSSPPIQQMPFGEYTVVITSDKVILLSISSGGIPHNLELDDVHKYEIGHMSISSVLAIFERIERLERSIGLLDDFEYIVKFPTIKFGCASGSIDEFDEIVDFIKSR